MTQNKNSQKGTRKTKHRGRNDGAIFSERNGNYRAQVSLADGRRRSKTFKTKEECKLWIREMHTKPPMVEIPQPATVVWTVKNWFMEWLEQSKNLVRPNTHYDYQRYSERFIFPMLGDTPLAKLDRRQVNSFYHDLSLKQKLGVSSVRLVHRILHRALEMAAQVNMITSNPATAQMYHAKKT